MIDFITEFGVFLIQTIFWYVALGVLLKALQGHLNKKNQEIEEMLKHIASRVHSVKIEQQGDMYFWFDADDDIFIAQGQTDQEIQEVLRQSWQQHIFLLEKQQILLAGPKFDPIWLNTTLTK